MTDRPAVTSIKIKPHILETRLGLSRGEAKPQRCDPHGVPFDTLTLGGIKPEGEAFATYADSPEQAVGRFTEALESYLADRPGQRTVHWRQEPGAFYCDWNGMWQAAARLSVSAPQHPRHSPPKAAGQ